MELLRAFINMDECRQVPSKRTVVNSATAILFLFIVLLSVIEIITGSVLWLKYGEIPNIENLVILTIGGWLLITSWFLVSKQDGYSTSKISMYVVTNMLGVYLLSSILHFAFFDYEMIGLGAVTWFAMLGILSAGLKKYSLAIIKMRWIFLGMAGLFYCAMFVFDLYDQISAVGPALIVQSTIGVVELSLISYFILLEMAYFQERISANYDEMAALGEGRILDLEDTYGEWEYTMQTIFVLQVNFLMLLMFCFRITGFVLYAIETGF